MSENDERTMKDIEAEARERIEEMPAETALGNRDPEGGGEGTPKEFEETHGDSSGNP